MPYKTIYQVQYLLTDLDTYNKTVIKETNFTTKVPRRDLLIMERIVNEGMDESLTCRIVMTKVDEDCDAYKEAVENTEYYLS